MQLPKQTIFYLWQQYVSGQATAEELNQLFDAIRDAAHDDENIQSFQEAISKYPASISLSDDSQANMWEYLFQLTNKVTEEALEESSAPLPAHLKSATGFSAESAALVPSPPRRIHFLKTTWFRYAAAILLIAGTAAYLFTPFKKTEQPLANGNKPLQTDIAPGRDRAILTLASGQRVVLDSTQGNIVKQDGLTVVNLAGKLEYKGAGTEAEYNTLSTPKGGQYQIVLPDGTKVWLNAASSITFPTAFAGNARYVEISGEAYLEVAKKANQSFIVKTNKAEIQVLGTSFNINAYENESTTKTTLISGRVKVTGPQSKVVILKPGQQAILTASNPPSTDNKNGAIITVSNIDPDQVTAWKNGMFNFENIDFEEVMRQLERWYNIEVVYEKGVPTIEFGGKLSRNISLKDLLEILKRTEVHFKLVGKNRLIVEQS